MKKGREDPQKEIAKTLKSIRKDINEIAKAGQKSSKIKFTIEYITLGIVFIALILNARAVIITSRQLNEMSRKPKLSLEVREPEPVDTIYNKINNNAMIFRCDLVNSGNDDAKNIEIGHSLNLDTYSSLSIRVTSQTEDDISSLYSDRPIDTTSLSSPKSPDYTKCDTFFFPKLPDSVKIDTVRFPSNTRNWITLEVHKHYESISYGRPFKLHYTWLLWNISPKTDAYYIPYFIYSDKETFEGTLRIKNPFYINDKIQK